ncbi:uncharacterized protein LOC135213789 [Macrobrachium nipponense]|uniref:uncharacterized protein LOC135213789 n=1 Tax=Macrobrachium nipponense TaxID=159736 RepID=UPI0030C8CF05
MERASEHPEVPGRRPSSNQTCIQAPLLERASERPAVPRPLPVLLPDLGSGASVGKGQCTSGGPPAAFRPPAKFGFGYILQKGPVSVRRSPDRRLSSRQTWVWAPPLERAKRQTTEKRNKRSSELIKIRAKRRKHRRGAEGNGGCDGGRGGRPLWFLLLLLLAVVLPASLVSGECVVDVCCCYSDNYNTTYRDKINAFTNPPTPPDYQYTGIKPKGKEVYEPCFCSDVTVGVTSITLTEATYVADAADATKRTSLQNTVTTKLNALKGNMTGTEVSLVPTLISLKAIYANNTASSVVFKVEILLRGRNEGVSTPVTNALVAALAGKSLGNVNTQSLSVSVLTCSGNPPDPLLDGTRTDITSYVASAQVIYGCIAKYRLSNGKAKEISTCSPYNATWTPLPDGIKCEIAPDVCAEDPPTPPPLTVSSWNNFTKSGGHVVNYLCMDGYSSENKLNASSTCQNGLWSAINPAFKCIQTGCLESPPQVPSQGVLDWNLQRANGTTITYSCNKGFKSNTGLNPVVNCFNMTWKGFPEKWACVDEKTKLHLKGALEGGDVEELNLFYVVTIPSVGALCIMIICCLCCTRIDSPLFNICSVKTPKNAGYSKA